MNSLVCFVSLAAVIWAIRGRRDGLVFLLVANSVATPVGISRIYLGVHYFSDVVGGLLAGSAWLLIDFRNGRPGPRQVNRPRLDSELLIA
jgi:undecaprenyl-diphosphatase